MNDLLILLLSRSALLILWTIQTLLYNMKPTQETTVLGSVFKLLPGNQLISHQIYWSNWPPIYSKPQTSTRGPYQVLAILWWRTNYLKLQNYLRRELPTTIANVVPPPQLYPKHVINSLHPAVSVQDTALQTNVAIHRPSLPPVILCILDKICKCEYIEFSTLNTKAMFGTPEPTTQISFTV